MQNRLLFIICVTIFCSISYAQDSIQKQNSDIKDVLEPIVLDETPVYPGCKRKKTEAKRKKCMSDKVSKYISKKYDLDIFNTLNFPEGKYTVTVMFKLDKQGEIIEARARGPHKLLEQEAIRVINSLPRITPGKVKGRPVIIPFAIPIYLTSH